MEKKTFKREIALALLVFIFYLGIYEKVEVLEILAWPMMSFVFAAFGMDWAGKQTELVSKGNKNAVVDK